MIDDFFIRALLAGVGVALAAAPLGCFVIWRRMAYFGDTLAHASLLGVALGLLLAWSLPLSVFMVAVLIALTLLVLERSQLLPTDSLLGMLSHGALAVGLLVLAVIEPVQVNVLGFLFGDILATSNRDLVMIYGGGAVLLAMLLWIWRPLFAASVSAEVAVAEQKSVKQAELIFMLLLALAIAMAMQIVGVLLAAALLIIPAAAARHLAQSPEQMAVLAALAGMAAVVAGLFASLQFDTPPGPTIIVAALGLFLLGFVWRSVRN